MLIKPCRLCQDSKTQSCSVWLLRHWNTACKATLTCPGAFKEETFFLSKVFPSPKLTAGHFASAWKIEMHFVFILSWITSLTEMAAECKWRMPFNDRRGGGGIPAAHCGIVSTPKERTKGRKRWRGAEREPVPTSFSGTTGGLVWAVTLNTSILTLRRSERLVSFNSAAISKHGEACNSNTSNGFLWINKQIQLYRLT